MFIFKIIVIYSATIIKGLKVDFGLSFNSFFDKFILAIISLAAWLYLDFYWSFKTHLEEVNKARFYQNSVCIKLNWDRLEVF